MADITTDRVPVAFLRECIAYDPETGAFTWRDRPPEHFAADWACERWSRCKAGTPVFGKSSRRRRYPRVTITYRGDEIELLAHRVAWALATGRHAPGQVDHKNCDPFDNRFENLRLSSQSQNNMNRRKYRSKSPYKGVSRCAATGRWRAQINKDNTPVYLGRFDTAEEAHAAYCAAAAEYFGEFARVA